MLNMIDDGVWCKTCRKFHPTMRWHKKNGQEDTRKHITEYHKRSAEKRPALYGINDKADNEKEAFLNAMIEKIIERRNIVEAETGEYIICGYPTVFISKKTKRYVCSDECLYRENKWKLEASLPYVRYRGSGTGHTGL